MKKKANAILFSDLVVFVFLIVVIMYYFVYQKFHESRQSTYTITDSRPVVSDGISFQGDVKRFLTVYDTQEFASKQNMYDFLVLELNRFSLYPVDTAVDGEVREIVMDNIKSILNKMELGSSDVSQETSALQELLNNLN